MNLQKIGANQTEITDGDIIRLFSYSTPVAYIKGGEGFRTSNLWSVTTAKHVSQFFKRYGIKTFAIVSQNEVAGLATL